MGLGLVFCFLTKTKEERDGRSRRAECFAILRNQQNLFKGEKEIAMRKLKRPEIVTKLRRPVFLEEAAAPKPPHRSRPRRHTRFGIWSW